MIQRLRRLVTAGAAVLAPTLLAACGDGPAAPAPGGSGPEFAKGGNGTASSASGAGVAEFGIPGFGPAYFAFKAKQHKNGTASGWFRQYRTREGLTIDFTGRVTCLAVDPVNRRAWVGGVITENNSTDPTFRTAIHEPGDDVWFRVVDYGEGANDPPDRTTTYGFEGSAGIITSEEYCAVRPWPNEPVPDARTFPVTQGDIRVRP